jgi:aspartate-semialdehyde dehydrogenase
VGSKFAAQELRLLIHQLGEWILPKIDCSEINAAELTAADKIIANPNCSPFKCWFLLLCIKIQHQTCDCFNDQSITGTGVKAVQQLENEYAGVQGEMAYKYPIHRNAIPQCDSLKKMDIPKKR